MKKVNDYDVEIIDVSKLKVEHCLGCFRCWSATPGVCVIKDDMKECIQKYVKADVIIWSFPLYYFSMPSKVKAFMDRLLPINIGKMVNTEKGAEHPVRYDMNKKYLLISSCGFPNIENNYEALIKQFEIVFKGSCEMILCAEGGLLTILEAAPVVNRYLSKVIKAGGEYATTYTLSEKSKEELSELIIPKEMYVNASNME